MIWFNQKAKNIAKLFAIVSTITITAPAWAQNILDNPGFEDDVGPVFGNNIDNTSIDDWIIIPGNRPNVVRVDGPGGDDYIRGPESDASNPGPNITQQYLDIVDGANDFYQVFTVPTCPISGQIQRYNVSGHFSSRADPLGNALTASGSIRILLGAGPTGPVVAGPTLEVANVQDRLNWTQVSGEYLLEGGVTYTYIVSMDNDTNFDEAFLGNISNCSFTGEADLQTVKTLASSDTTPNVGDIVTYNITVTNNGTIDATGVSLTDLIPSELTATSNNGNVSGTGASTGGSYNDSNGLWTIGDLANGETATLTIEGIVNTGEGGNTIVNTTTAANGDQPDSSTIDDDLTESVTVVASADLSVLKTNTDGVNGNVDQGNDTVFSGSSTTYTVTVTNNGPSTITGALVKDTVGTGLTCDPAASVTIAGNGVPSGSFTIADLTGAGITLGTLADGEATTLSYSCTVN